MLLWVKCLVTLSPERRNRYCSQFCTTDGIW